MFRACVLGLMVFCGLGMLPAAAADKLADEAAEAELEKLQGDWELHGDEVDGKLSRAMLDRAIPFTAAWSVKGDQLAMTSAHGSHRSTLSGKVKLMPASNPPGIDFTYETTAAEKVVTLRGVYELKEDRLRIRWAKTGAEKRPDKVGAKTGDDSLTHVFLRSKRKQSAGK